MRPPVPSICSVSRSRTTSPARCSSRRAASGCDFLSRVRRVRAGDAALRHPPTGCADADHERDRDISAGSVDVLPRRWQNGRVTSAERMSTEWGECWLDPSPMPREFVADLKRRTGGIVPAWAPRLASVTWVVGANALGVQERVAFMPLGLWDLIGFVVSQDNSCRYCYGITRTVLKVLGYRDAQVDRIERDVHLAELPPAEEAALVFARKLSHANPRPVAADCDALERAGHDRAAVAEIACVAAFAGFSNRVATCFAI